MKTSFRQCFALFHFFVLVFIASSSCSQGTGKPSSTAIADTCDNPDASIGCCFVNMPVQLSHRTFIAGKKEPGERMVIKGRLLKPDSTSYAGVLMYVYHTDNKGLYSKKGDESGFQKWHGYLHGWCLTDADGNYELHTIRPARYPGNQFPAHIHAAVKEPSGKAYYISDFVFADDSLVNADYLKQISHLKGGTGIVNLVRSGGVWTGVRDIVLK